MNISRRLIECYRKISLVLTIQLRCFSFSLPIFTAGSLLCFVESRLIVGGDQWGIALRWQSSGLTDNLSKQSFFMGQCNSSLDVMPCLKLFGFVYCVIALLINYVIGNYLFLFYRYRKNSGMSILYYGYWDFRTCIKE